MHLTLLTGLFGTASLTALLPILQVLPNLFMDPLEIENFDTAYDDPPIVFEPPTQSHLATLLH